MPPKYMSDNLEYERAKDARNFLKHNQILVYSETLGDTRLKGYLTRSISIPSDWRDSGFEARLFLTNISGYEVDPTLISEYIHSMGIVEYEWYSSTKVYSDNSIEFVRGGSSCSDVIDNDGTTSCDSVRITTIYWIKEKNEKLMSQSDTVSFEYEVK